MHEATVLALIVFAVIMVGKRDKTNGENICLVLFVLFLFLVPAPVEAGQRAVDFDRNQDGKLDRYEQQQYERNTGKLANDLRGGLLLEPQILRPYNPVIDNGEDKIEY